MDLSINAKVLAGTGIEVAVAEAISLSQRLAVAIEINFNGCVLRLHPLDKRAEKVAEYQRWLDTGAGCQKSP